MINAAACFMLVGRHVSRLAWYAVLGMLAAALGQVVAVALHAPRPVPIGDVNIAAASIASCGVLLLGRLCRL